MILSSTKEKAPSIPASTKHLLRNTWCRLPFISLSISVAVVVMEVPTELSVSVPCSLRFFSES